jgi:translocation and assembly module TamB
VRTVRGTDLAVRARIGGTLLEPRLSLESDQRPPLSETEIVSYLLFGRPSFDLLGAATGTGSEQAVLGGAVVGLGLSLAAGQLAQTVVANLGLPLDYIAIQPGAAGDRLGTTRVEAGTQIGERTFLKLNAPLCEVRRGLSGQLLGASIEYRLHVRWRLEASLEPLLQECRALGGAPRPSAPYQIGVDLFWQRGGP